MSALQSVKMKLNKTSAEKTQNPTKSSSAQRKLNGWMVWYADRFLACVSLWKVMATCLHYVYVGGLCGLQMPWELCLLKQRCSDKITHLLRAEGIDVHTLCRSVGPAPWTVTRGIHSHTGSLGMEVEVRSTLPSLPILYPAGRSRQPRRGRGAEGKIGASLESAPVWLWSCCCCSCLCLQPWGLKPIRFTRCRQNWERWDR